MSIIISATALEQLCNTIDTTAHFALDLEFIPERTYVPQLCLVQVCVDQQAYIIDPLSVKDLSPLWQRVADPSIAVVLHAGEQDLAIIHHLSSLKPSNVLDTQIAAGFLGFGYPAGYGKLLQQLLSISISKTETYTDWMRRPLTDNQIEYALNDVRHLPAMEHELREMLGKTNRISWVLDECALRYKSPRLFQGDPDRDFVKVKGSGSLSRRGLAVLRELYRVRLAEATATNRPPQKIIPDNLLLELARRPIKQVKDMERIRGIRHDHIAQYGDAVLEATNIALSLPEQRCPEPSLVRIPSRSEAMKTDVLFLLLKSFCHAEDLAPDLVATRADLELLVRSFNEESGSVENLNLIQGWRGDVVGRKLLQALCGAAVKLKIVPGGASVVLELDGD